VRARPLLTLPFVAALASPALAEKRVALDDGHSLYTRALATTMKRPGLELFQTFNEVGLTVE
jgi:hypothetical protein